MKRYYFLLGGAVVLDAAVLPWLFGASWLPKAVMMFLCFVFLRLERRNLYFIFALALAYLGVAGDFNLGILFLAMTVFLFFEKWFLVSFFHKEAWQTSSLSGLGIIVFYVVLGGLAGILTPSVFSLNSAWCVAAVLSAAGGSGINFLFRKFSS